MHGRGPDLNLRDRAVIGLAQDEHDDDDEKDEAEKAPADVETGRKQHVFVIPSACRSQTTSGFHRTFGLVSKITKN